MLCPRSITATSAHALSTSAASRADGYGDLVNPDEAVPTEELPDGVPGMMCHKCDQNLKGVALIDRSTSAPL